MLDCLAVIGVNNKSWLGLFIITGSCSISMAWILIASTKTLFIYRVKDLAKQKKKKIMSSLGLRKCDLQQSHRLESQLTIQSTQLSHDSWISPTSCFSSISQLYSLYTPYYTISQLCVSCFSSISQLYSLHTPYYTQTEKNKMCVRSCTIKCV